MQDRDSLLLPFEELSSSRRGFLQLVGFGIAGAALPGCSRVSERKAIPALTATRRIVAGSDYWIATTCAGCEAGCGALARCRDGRPIKLEGNPASPVSAGGLCPSGQGSLLGLYDSKRLTGPMRAGGAVSWKDADDELMALLDSLRTGGGRVRVLTGTLTSPSTRAAIERFVGSFADGAHVVYDALGASAVLEAHERTHGKRVLPRYRFDAASTVVSFGADFLSTWISPVEFSAGYAAARDVEAHPERAFKHVQLEARLSLTGSRADERVRLAPWEVGAALAGLCELLEREAGVRSRFAGALETAPARARLEAIAASLWLDRGAALVIADSDDVGEQVLVNYANHLLGGYGSTLDLERASLQRGGGKAELASLRAELESGSVDALIIAGCNPAYELGESLPLAAAGVLVSCASSHDETSALASWILPEPHYLAAWNDAEPHEASYALSQPTVPALRDTRTLRATLSRWSGDQREDAELLREYWRASVFPRQSEDEDFDTFFDKTLARGHLELPIAGDAPLRFSDAALEPLRERSAPAPGELGLVVYAKAGMLDGRNAQNPWLHELPDPVSKITWDNYACLSPTRARALEVGEGDVVRLASADGAATLELPVHVQPGQHDDVVAVATGYGVLGTDRFTNVGPEWIGAQPTVAEGGLVGVDVGPLARATGTVGISATGRQVELAATQDHHSLMVPEQLAIEGYEERDAVQEMTLEEWRHDPAAAIHGHHGPQPDLWPNDHPMETRWGLSIDLSRCTGCSACVVGCQAENNVPVVGRDEVRRHREMSWLRIDRYYGQDEDDLHVSHQPMMCQHCDRAPCESVCPVLATVHSSEGLNQQVYNRCVGTRYCANTCPYKVRRFNWFDYPREDRLENHALNPDVTVRSRGVMEKCSFCVQRIQDAKGVARSQGRSLADGDIQVACQQSCPTQAIVFGDLNDPESRVARTAASQRAYGVLEELNVLPSVRYLARVYNGTPSESGHGS